MSARRLAVLSRRESSSSIKPTARSPREARAWLRYRDRLGTDFDPDVPPGGGHGGCRATTIVTARSSRSCRRGYTLRGRLLRADDGEGGQGVSKRDYYEGPWRLTRSAERRRKSRAPIGSSRSSIILIETPAMTKAEEERFKEAAEAYGILADWQKRQPAMTSLVTPVSRAPLDGPTSTRRSLRTSTTSLAMGSETSSASETSSVAGGRRGGPARGADLRYDLSIPF